MRIPDYAFNRTKVTNKVRNERHQTFTEASEAEVAGADPYRVLFDVTVTDMLSDPMAAVMLLSHLRQLLNGPDIGKIRLEIEYEFEGLSRDQIATLFAFSGLSWSGLHVAVNEERRFYDDRDMVKQDTAA